MPRRTFLAVASAVLCTTMSAWVAAPASAASLPPAPFLESVSPEGRGGLVSWAPDPASAAVTSYAVQALAAPGTTLPSGCGTTTISVPSSDTATVIGGLCKGAAYVARVRAVNAAGTGAWSANSNPFAPLPAQAPGAPLVTSVLGRDHALAVSWTAPALNGGSALTAYVVKATGGGSSTSVTVEPTVTSTTLSGLIDGTVYTVSVVAKNQIGSSEAATASGTPKVAYAPAAPQQVAAVPSGSGAVEVSWQPPADDGGSSISSYQVTYQQMVRNSSGQWVAAPESQPRTTSVAAPTTSLSVSGLSPVNAFWSFSVAAVNGVATGAAAPLAQPVSPQTTTAANVVVLSQATMESLSSDEGGQLTWPSPSPAQVTELKAGEVIVAAPSAAAPQGLLDTVASVAQNGSGEYTVGIAQAALSEVFTGLSLAGTLNPLTPASGQQAVFHPAIAGVQLLPKAQTSTSAGVSFNEDIALSLSYGAGPLKLSGELDLTPSVGIYIALTHNFVGVPDGARVSASASIGAKATLTASLSGSWKKQIGELDGPPEDYQIGPVPVIVVPKIPIFLTASGEITASVRASIKIGAQATWDSHQPGTLSVKNTSTPLTVSGNPLDNVAASATIGLQEQPQMDLYDAAGPNFEADENLKATLVPNPEPGKNYFTLEPSLVLKAGWDVDFLGFHASLDATLANLSFTAFSIAKPPGAFLTVSPASPSVPAGATQQFSAVRSDGQSFPVTWSVIGGAGDTVSSSGMLKTVALAGRTLTMVATDSTGASGKTTVTVGQPFDPPLALQATSAKDGRSATLTWQSPPDTGGAAVSSYTIVTDPQTTVQTVPGTSTEAQLPGLTPGVTYVVSLYATNSSGLQSAPASTYLTPTVTCSIDWTGPSGGSWSTPSNWDQNRVPNADDLVCMEGGEVALEAATSVYGIRLNGSTLKANAELTVSDLLALEGGSLQSSSAATVTLLGSGRLTLPSGSLNGVHLVNRGEAIVTGPSSFSIQGAATLENAGRLELSDGATLGWDGNPAGRVQNDGGGMLAYPGGSQGAVVYAPLRNSGTVSAVGGTLALASAVTQTSTGSFAGTGSIVLQSTFNPVGNGVRLQDATVSGEIVGPGTVTVPAGGTVQLTYAARLTNIDLVNRGTVAIGPESIYVSIIGATTFENAGSLHIADGVSIDWDGNSAGALVNDAGATLDYSGGSQGSWISSPLRNSGMVSAAPGTFTFTGAVSETSTGAFAGAGQIVLQSSFAPVGAGVNLQNATVTGSLVGPGTITVPAGAAVQLAPGARISSVDLLNRGSLTVGPGPASVWIEGATTLENAGTLALDDNSSIGWDGNSSGKLLNDAGATIAYAGGSQGSSIYAPVHNSGGVSAASGTLNLQAPVAQTSTGSFTGAGTIVLNSAFAPQGSGVTLEDVTLDNGVLGPGTVTIPAGASVQTGSGAYFQGVYLVNKGTLTLGSPSYELSVRGATTLENQGTLVINDGTYVGWDGNTSGQMLNESGATILYQGGSRGATVTVPFDNHGLVAADVGSSGGTLAIDSGNTLEGVDTGAYSASSGGAIELSGGERVLSSGSSFQGEGRLEVTNGQVVVPGALTVSNLSMGGSGELVGPGTVTVASGGHLTLGAISSLVGGVRLVNDGSGTVQGNGAIINDGSTLENAGTLELADGSSLSYNTWPSSGQLVNDAGATISYTGGTQGANVQVPFDNHGTVSASVGVRGGTLYFGSGNSTGSSDTGLYSVSSGGTIDFSGGTRVLGSGFAFQGPGQLLVGGGVLQAPGAASISNLAIGGSGQLTGPGTVTVPSGGRLTLSPGGSLAGGVRLVNRGTATEQIGNAFYIAGGSTLENAAIMQLADGSQLSYVGGASTGELLNDAGATLSYAGGSQGASVNVSFDNHGSVGANVGTRGGTLAFSQGNGSKASDTGSYSASAGGTIDFSGGTRALSGTVSLSGPGAIAVGGGRVVNSGVGKGAALRLEGGVLEITPQATGKDSSLSIASQGTVQFDLSSSTPTAAPAHLAIGGEASLGGTLVLQPLAGFAPPAGTVLHLLEYGSRTGQFASVVSPSGTVQYTVEAGAKSLTATVSG